MSTERTISPDPKIAGLYDNVPEEPLNRLLSFRERYPYQTIELGGTTWRFIDTGEGDTPLFIPAGGTMIAEVSFSTLDHFAQEYRVIAPDYPPINTVQALNEGFLGLLDYLGVDEFYALGGSYGGWMMQSLVHHAPERLRKLVISAVGPPDGEIGRQIARSLRWFRFSRTSTLRQTLYRSFAGLDEERSRDPEQILLWTLVYEIVSYRLTRADMFATMKRLVDLTESAAFSPQDLDDWPGRMLLIFGTEDPATPLEKREAMKQLYPGAEVKEFEGGEHGIALTHQEDYFAAIDEFLR